MNRLLPLLVALALFAAACARVQHAPDRDDGRDGGGRGRGRTEVGLASFYADALEGRRTASGERYRARAATCAHRSHPFGTELEVEVLDTGERAICRVNDRGPFVRGRVVDLSKRTARDLDIVGRGVARVRVRPVR